MSLLDNEKDHLRASYTNLRDPATPGSPLQFLSGLALAAGGVFLVLQNTTLYTAFTLADLLGFTPPFGLLLIPLLIGIGLLCFNPRALLGWFLTGGGLLLILLGILMGLRIEFRPVTLFTGLLMFGLIASGLGLMARHLRR